MKYNHALPLLGAMLTTFLPLLDTQAHNIDQITPLQSNAGESRERDENDTIAHAPISDDLKAAMFSVIRVDQIWKNRSVLKVCFGPLAAVRSEASTVAQIEAIASEWTANLSIKFDFGGNTTRVCTQVSSADIRVDMAPAIDDSHAVFQSLIGNEAESHSILGDAPYTMQLFFPTHSSFFQTPAVFRFYVLHEFGHALGASHEHQKINCMWNYSYVAMHFGFSSDADAKQNLADIFGYAASAFPDVGVTRVMDLIASPYDKYSIMQYNMTTSSAPDADDPNVYLDGTGDICYRPGWVSQLSDYDKAGMRAAYSNQVGAAALLASLDRPATPVAAPAAAIGSSQVVNSSAPGVAPAEADNLSRLQSQIQAIQASPTSLRVVSEILQGRIQER